MKGLYVGKGKRSYIEKAEQNSGQLKLIAHGDESEVMIQEIESDKVIIIAPADRQETMEFFYIQEGSLLYEEEDKQIIVNKDEFFYVHHLKEKISFKTLEATKLLYFSTQPVFHYLSDSIKDLYQIVEKVEKKDIYTHNHGKRVEDLSAEIGKRIGLKGERFSNLCYAALFHDIGKINVPDGVLNKPDRLTDEEYDIIKKHPSDGYSMVQGTFLENIGVIIKQHHERIDGSGYPEGLKDEDILLEAKIIGVVDSYDAMVNDRPYRKGMSEHKAINELKRLSGIKYDKEVVDIFVDVLNRI